LSLFLIKKRDHYLHILTYGNEGHIYTVHEQGSSGFSNFLHPGTDNLSAQFAHATTGKIKGRPNWTPFSITAENFPAWCR